MGARRGGKRRWQWSPGTAAESTRPVSPVHDPEYDVIWDTFYRQFAFKPGMQSIPAISEPVASVTWHLDTVDDHGDQTITELEAILHGGLLACTRPGEELY